jgi:hypothetical protein
MVLPDCLTLREGLLPPNIPFTSSFRDMLRSTNPDSIGTRLYSFDARIPVKDS